MREHNTLLSENAENNITYVNGVAVNSTTENQYRLNGQTIYINFIGISTLEQLKQKLASNPITIYYELATPIETDLSTILQDIEINDFGMVVRNAEALGSVVFNTNNNLPVPSTETYLIKSV